MLTAAREHVCAIQQCPSSRSRLLGVCRGLVDILRASPCFRLMKRNRTDEKGETQAHAHAYEDRQIARSGKLVVIDAGHPIRRWDLADHPVHHFQRKQPVELISSEPKARILKWQG